MRSGRFDFGSVLDTALDGYVSRTAAEDRIRAYVEASEASACIVTGEPGSGKTALAAAVIRQEGYLHYFLRQGHIEFGLWRDPYAFLTAVGYQLWDRFGDTIFPPTVGIDVEGRVQDVTEGGSVTGVEIERLVPLPWRSAQINVALAARDVAGEAVGVRIKEVVEDYRFLDLRTFREIALFDPLRRLARQAPEQRVVLWVDGLDEEVQATHTPNQTITALLPIVAELQALGNLVLIASSQPGPHLDRLRGDTALDLDLAEFPEENNQTIGQVIDQEVADPEVTAALEAAHWDPQELRAELLASSDNFLYIRHFFRAVRAGEAEALRSTGLPGSLNEIFARMLSRLVSGLGSDYLDRLHPVVRVLAVAREPLLGSQLTDVTGLKREAVNDALAHLRQFLDEAPASPGHDGGSSYSFFSTAFRDALGDPANSEQRWYVDLPEAHGAVADHYLASDTEAWEGLDDYGFAFLVEHLELGTKAHRRRLVRMLDESWRRMRRSRSRSNRAFEEDLHRGAACLASLPPEEVLPEALKLSLMAATLRRAAANAPRGAVEVMARLGQTARALEYVVPGPTAGEITSRAAEVVAGIAGAEQPDWPLLHQTLEAALRSEAHDHGALSILLEAWPARDDPETRALLDYAIEVFNEGKWYWGTPPALMELARLTAVFDPEEASRLFDACLSAIPEVSSSAVNIYHAELLEKWAEVDRDAAVAAIPKISWRPDHYAIEGPLAALGNDESTRADRRAVLEHMGGSLFPAIDDPYELALALSVAARAEARLGDQDRAEDLLDRAVTATEAVGGEHDPASDLQSRAAMAAEVWVRLAEAAQESGLDAASGLLERAWREAAQHDVFNGSTVRARLVCVQLRESPALLEARLATIDGPARRADFLTSAAAELAGNDRAAAAAHLEQALIAAESATRPLGAASELPLAIALRLRSGGVDGAALDEIDQYELDYRFAVLTDLIERDDGAASDWLADTIELWASEEDNYTIERAASLSSLPEPLLSQALARVDHIASQGHRSLLAGVLSSRLATTDPETAHALREAAVEAVEGHESPRIRDFEILAAIAGHWWSADRSVADRLWDEALFRASSAGEGDPRRQSHEITLAIRALMHGAPQAALAVLLCHQEPPPDPSTLTLVVPGPGVPPLLAAGMPGQNLLLVEALAGALGRGDISPTDQLGDVRGPEVASGTWALAAAESAGAPLGQRASWCEAAVDNALQVDDHHLRCLLLAGAAEAFLAIGMRSKAAELARLTGGDVLDNGDAFGAIYREPAYAHALGKCVTVIVEESGPAAAVDWIWAARVLGQGLERFAAYIPGWIPDGDLATGLEALSRARRHALALFS